jgi:hypothetical protein
MSARLRRPCRFLTGQAQQRVSQLLIYGEFLAVITMVIKPTEREFRSLWAKTQGARATAPPTVRRAQGGKQKPRRANGGALARGRPARSRRHARRLDAAIGDDRCCASGSANDGHGVVIRRRGGPGVGEKLDKVAGKIRDGHQADEGHDGGNRRPAPSEILTDRKHLTNFPMSTLLRTAGRMVWLRYKHISGAGLLGYDRNSVAKRFDP